MRQLIDAFLGLAEVGIDGYMNARARFFKALAMLFSLIMLQWIMNYCEFPIINVLVFIVLFGLTAYAWTHPIVAAALVSLEAIRKKKKEGATEIVESKKPTPENTNWFALYLAYVLLWLCIVSMFIVSLPLNWYLSFKEALGATFVGMMFLAVIAWTSYFKWTKISLYKRVISSYAIAGFLVCVWMIIPGSIKFAITGADVYGPLGTSEAAKAMAKEERKIKVKVDKDKAEKIKKIGNILAENGRDESALSFEERAIWHEAQKEVKDASLPEKLSQIELPSFGKKDSAYVPPPTPALAATPAPAPIAQITAEAPPQKQSALCNYSSGTLYWGEGFTGGADVNIECSYNEVILKGSKATFYVTNGKWYEDENNHGSLALTPVSKGNIIAEGTMGTGEGKIPLRLRRG